VSVDSSLDNVNEYGRFLRIKIQATSQEPDTLVYTFDNDYQPNLIRLRFYNRVQTVTDNGFAAKLPTLNFVMRSGWDYLKPGEIIPTWADAYNY